VGQPAGFGRPTRQVQPMLATAGAIRKGMAVAEASRSTRCMATRRQAIEHQVQGTR